MSVASIGARIETSPFQEMQRDKGAAQRAVIIEQLVQAMPGNDESVSRQEIAAAADIERISLAFNKKLQFIVDHQSNEVIVKVIDGETDKVIKVLPPEELQRLHNKLKETIGFLFDQRV